MRLRLPAIRISSRPVARRRGYAGGWKRLGAANQLGSNSNGTEVENRMRRILSFCALSFSVLLFGFPLSTFAQSAQGTIGGARGHVVIPQSSKYTAADAVRLKFREKP